LNYPTVQRLIDFTETPAYPSDNAHASSAGTVPSNLDSNPAAVFDPAAVKAGTRRRRFLA
jgi:hypothetical protein